MSTSKYINNTMRLLSRATTMLLDVSSSDWRAFRQSQIQEAKKVLHEALEQLTHAEVALGEEKE